MTLSYLLRLKETILAGSFASLVFAGILTIAMSPAQVAAQQGSPAAAPAPAKQYTPMPSLEFSSMDLTADPCVDFYKFACGNYARQHPIPPDQSTIDPYFQLDNLNMLRLQRLLEQAVADPAATTNTRKIGDYYKACLNTDAIEEKRLEPLAELLHEIDSMRPAQAFTVAGKLHRFGVYSLFSYTYEQDLQDATREIAVIDQSGLGLGEKAYYFRTGPSDIKLRRQYVQHIAKTLVLAGSSASEAQRDAQAILVFETGLAHASMGIVDRRDAEKHYHVVPLTKVAAEFPIGAFDQYLVAVRSPTITVIDEAVPGFVSAMAALVRSTDIRTLRAYMRYMLLTTVAYDLPKALNDESFAFYETILNGTQIQKPRSEVCARGVDSSMGEALGQLFVERYFPADSKSKVAEMIADIEAAMDRNIDTLDWMSAATKLKAKEKLRQIANKIGYPERWRDYTALEVKPDDAVGNMLRANAFEHDRGLNKIGRPVDRLEWQMTPPTANAYYDSSMNDMNFPAGILQPGAFDPAMDDAVNYGHTGATIGHELTHGFDDQGRKFDGKGNLNDWWTPEDKRKFAAKSACLVEEYSKFNPVDNLHIDGNLTLGENTADNGGMVLAYLAFLEREKKNHVDLSAKIDGYTGPQRFYLAYAQDNCGHERPAYLRTLIQTDPHSPDRFRVTGTVRNQPGFAAAFQCKVGSPMVPVKSCRVW